MTSSIREYHQQFQSGRATPRDVIEESIARIEARNSELNAFISVDWARARREADEASERYRTGLIRGVLDGVPVGLKDLFNTQGIATTAASKILLKNVPNDDAAVVSQLHLAGANTRLGKLNLHEFAFSPTGTASYFGPMKNPHDPTRMAGGSSGGSGIAVATRMVTTALGTDTGGSVRIPAAFCGIYGLKPTYDGLSRHGVIPLSWTLDHVGILADSLDNLAVMSTCLGFKDPDLTGSESFGFPDMRVLWLQDDMWDPLDEVVQNSMRQVIQRMIGMGIDIVPGDLPRAGEIRASQQVILGSEAANYHWLWLQNQPEDYQPDVRERLTTRASFLAIHYIEALRRRQELIMFYRDTVFRDVAFIVSPTVPIRPPKLEVDQVNGIDVRQVLTVWTAPFNLLGLPAVTLPVGRPEEGMGLQIVAPWGEERRLLQFAASVHGGYRG